MVKKKRRVPPERVPQGKGRVSPRTSGRSNITQGVSYVRNEVTNLIPQYFLIRDAIEGEPAIKGLMGGIATTAGAIGDGGLPLTVTNIILTRAMRYLPMPNAEDTSQKNMERYKAYVTRAVWYGVTSRTLEGMAGQVFLRDPKVNIPKGVDVLVKDSNGSGLTLNQAAHRAIKGTLSYGRFGLLVDFPETTGVVTKQQQADGDIRPTFHLFFPWDIINWRVTQIGAKRKLTMLVLREVLDEEGDDGFQLTTFEQYRVLRIDPDTGNHVVELYQASGDKGFTMIDNITPKDASGKPLDYIPFTFIGSENNDISPNRPPLYDLASMNIGHYRNSADYEEASFIAGQPTPVLSGLSEDWVKNVMGGEVTLGSRGAVPLPVGARADLLQAKPNSMPFEAMAQKEHQMIALGAKLVELQKTAKTATEQIIETTSESSVLANCAMNVSSAFEWGLKVAASYVTTDKPGTIQYQLNKDFDLTSMTADDQNAIIKQWQSGAIMFEEMRNALTKAGIATEVDPNKAKAAIQKEIAEGLIPNPAMVASSMTKVPDAKSPSDAGGPQPKLIRKQPSPQGAA